MEILVIALGVALATLSVVLVWRWDRKNRALHPDAPRVWFQMNRGNKRW